MYRIWPMCCRQRHRGIKPLQGGARGLHRSTTDAIDREQRRGPPIAIDALAELQSFENDPLIPVLDTIQQEFIEKTQQANGKVEFGE